MVIVGNSETVGTEGNCEGKDKGAVGAVEGRLGAIDDILDCIEGDVDGCGEEGAVGGVLVEGWVVGLSVGAGPADDGTADGGGLGGGELEG